MFLNFGLVSGVSFALEDIEKISSLVRTLESPFSDDLNHFSRPPMMFTELASYVVSPPIHTRYFPDLLAIVKSWTRLPKAAFEALWSWHAWVQAVPPGPPVIGSESIDYELTQIIVETSTGVSDPMRFIPLAALLMTHWHFGTDAWNTAVRTLDLDSLLAALNHLHAVDIEREKEGGSPIGLVQRLLGSFWLYRSLREPPSQLFANGRIPDERGDT